MGIDSKALTCNRMHVILDDEATAQDLDYQAEKSPDREEFSRITIGMNGILGSQFVLSAPNLVIVEMLEDLLASLR